MSICLECKVEFNDDASLHHHLKSHKIKVADYYIKHFNRRDKFSNDLLPFRDKDSYFETEFISKTNLRLWLKGQGKEVQREYCRELIKKRIEKKNLTCALSQVELRSLPLPSVNFLHGLFINYNEFCVQLGLKIRFSNYPGEVIYNSVQNKVNNILCDSREQVVMNLDFPIEIKTLNFADYCLDNPSLNDNVYIEKKSMVDWIGTFGRGIERFSSEIERAALQKAYIVVLVEDTIEHALSFNHLPWIHAKVQPEHIFHNIRSLLQKYSNLQFVFCSGKKESVRIAKRILFEKGLARETDLQLSNDLGVL